MRVLICGEVLHLGGAETVSIDLANALAARGVEVAYSAAPGPLDARLAKAVRFEETPPLTRATALAFARRRAAILRGYRPDVVHTQGATLALAARAVAAFSGRPRPAIVLTHHSTHYRRASSGASRLLLRAACDQLVAISTLKQQQFLAMGFPAERVALIPNVVDCRAIANAASGADRERLARDLALCLGKSRLGVLAAEQHVLQLGPECLLDPAVVAQPPVADHPVRVLELGLQDRMHERVALLQIGEVAVGTMRFAVACPLDLDDVCAIIAQNHSRSGRRNPRCNIDHPDARLG